MQRRWRRGRRCCQGYPGAAQRSHGGLSTCRLSQAILEPSSGPSRRSQAIDRLLNLALLSTFSRRRRPRLFQLHPGRLRHCRDYSTIELVEFDLATAVRVERCEDLIDVFVRSVISKRRGRRAKLNLVDCSIAISIPFFDKFLCINQGRGEMRRG